MVGRREVVGGGMLAGLASVVSPQERGTKEADDSAAVVRAIDRLREVLERPAGSCTLGTCGTADSVRAQQKTFLKANQKFPDYLDAGIDAWCELYDWHVRNRQPINTSRLPDGRYGLTFMFTTVVLRPDQAGNFIGWGYDAR
jgi:hypothetical protein